MKDIILYVLLGMIAIWVLYKVGIFGNRRGSSKSSRDRDKLKSTKRKQGITLWFLKQCTGIATMIGGNIPEYKLFEYQYKIDRCDIRVKSLSRTIKPIELIGIFRLFQFIIILVTILLFSFTFKVGTLLLLTCCVLPKLYILILDGKISAEDEELEKNFPDLYLLLYSRLTKGAHAKIEPTVKDYIKSLDDIYGVGVGHIAIRRFCSRFIANVEIYGDESVAIRKLRERYRSPTVVNFCNLASQSLSGVDNADKLLCFKQELSEAHKRQMEKDAQRLVAKGNRTVYLVYIVLFEFILLSWVSKIDMGLIGKMF